jgi:hypothetical protein
MSLKQPKNSLLDRVQSIPGLATRGVKAELVGRRSIKVSQNGRYVGLWREVIGSLEWYPAGQPFDYPQIRTDGLNTKTRV